MLLELAYVIVTAPFRVWCSWRHKQFWRVDGPGYGWACYRCGIAHGFSAEDVTKLTAMYAEAGKRAAQELLDA